MRQFNILLILLAITCGAEAGLIQMHVHPALVRFKNNNGTVWDSDVLTYSNNIAGNGGTITAPDLLAVNTFVTSAKNNGYWTNILDCSPFAGDQTNAAVIKLKTDSGAAKKVFLYGYVDWSKQSGFANKGGNKLVDVLYTNTGWMGSNGMSFWMTYPSTNLRQGATGTFMGHTSGTGEQNFTITIQGSGAIGVAHSVYSIAGNTPSNPPAWIPGAGLYGFTRTATNYLATYQNGAFHQARTIADNYGANTFQHSVGIFNAVNPYGGYGSAYTTNVPVGWYALDNGMPTNMVPLYSADLATLMRSLGRGSDWHTNSTMKAVLILGQSLSCGGGSGTQPSTPLLTNQNSALLYCGGDTLPCNNANQRISARAGVSGWAESGSETGWQAFGTHLHWAITNAGYADEPIYLIHWGKSGEPYSTLKRGSSTNWTWQMASGNLTTNIYWMSTNDIAQSAATLKNIYGLSLNIIGIVSCHGEADRGNTGYAANLLEWAQNYAADIMSITGQTNSPKIYSWMESSYYYPNTASAYPNAGLGCLTNAELYPLTNKVISARYQMAHQSDNVHLYNTNYVWQGEYSAEAIFQDVWGSGWDALRPTNITRSGATITVTFNKPNLTFDTTLVSAAPNYGFNYTNSLGQTNISSVAVSGATTNQVVITLGTDPGATAGVLSYALNGTGGAPGPSTGARGNLRDQYSHTGYTTALNLYDWCVYFIKPVN